MSDPKLSEPQKDALLNLAPVYRPPTKAECDLLNLGLVYISNGRPYSTAAGRSLAEKLRKESGT